MSCARLVSLCMAVCAAAPNAAGAEIAAAPYKWVSSLEAVQEQIAQGSEAAHASLPKLIAETAKAIESTDAAVLLEPKNLRSVISYALSGGDERVLRHVLRLGGLSEPEAVIAKGALAYAEGRHGEALELLGGINARDLSPSLAGRVALIQGILRTRTDARHAIRLLDEARLLGTGTLVEEAALRRQAVLVAAAGDRSRFEWLSEQYFRRFGKSLYARFFMQQFSQVAAAHEFKADGEQIRRLQAIIDKLDASERRMLYLMLAESGVYSGNLVLTSFAAAQGAQISPSGSAERTRCELYAAAVNVAGDDPDAAIGRLRELQASRLGTTDAVLLTAALEVGESVLRPAADVMPINIEGETDVAEDANARQGTPPAGDANAKEAGGDEFFASASEVLKRADAALRGDRQR